MEKIIVSFLVLLNVTVIFSQTNVIEVNQNGIDNQIDVSQKGKDNIVSVTQDGNYNSAVIIQGTDFFYNDPPLGNGFIAQVQIGDKNKFYANQSGTSNKMYQTQVGTHNLANAVQDWEVQQSNIEQIQLGNYNSLEAVQKTLLKFQQIIQSQSGNFNIATAYQSELSLDNQIITQNQIGYANNLEAKQSVIFSSGYIIDQRQSGNENVGIANQMDSYDPSQIFQTQKGSGNRAMADQFTRNDYYTYTDNFINQIQIGDYNYAFAIQQNGISVKQSQLGNFNSVTAVLESGEVARISQNQIGTLNVAFARNKMFGENGTYVNLLDQIQIGEGNNVYASVQGRGKSYQYQEGSLNTASATSDLGYETIMLQKQTGFKNTAEIHSISGESHFDQIQNGIYNIVAVVEDGYYNKAVTIQEGYSNRVDSNQSGYDIYLDAAQVGLYNNLKTVQQGDVLSATIFQQGVGNSTVIIQE